MASFLAKPSGHFPIAMGTRYFSREVIPEVDDPVSVPREIELFAAEFVNY